MLLSCSILNLVCVFCGVIELRGPLITSFLFLFLGGFQFLVGIVVGIQFGELGLGRFLESVFVFFGFVLCLGLWVGIR